MSPQTVINLTTPNSRLRSFNSPEHYMPNLISFWVLGKELVSHSISPAADA